MTDPPSTRVGDAANRVTAGRVPKLLLVAGVVLFFIPEPATSVLGVLLVLIGGAGWAVARLLDSSGRPDHRGRRREDSD